MREILSIYKQNLKTLTSLVVLLLISCQTSQIDNISNESPSVESEINIEPEELSFLEVENPVVKEISDFNDIETTFSEDGELDYLKIPELTIDSISSELLEVTSSKYEGELLPLDYKLHPKKKVVKKVPKVKVVKKPKSPPVVTKTSNKVIAPPVVVKKNKSLPKKDEKQVKEEIIKLPPMTVVLGENFVIEMDQTGWIYEDELKGLTFNNKFYAGDKVLFEFVLTDKNIKEVRFSKYSTGDRVQSIIPIEISSSSSPLVKETVVITPQQTTMSLSEKELLELELKNIDKSDNPDEVYFKLAEIYLEEGLLKEAKEYYEYIYDNYPLSLYYEESLEKMEYILNNFLLVR